MTSSPPDDTTASLAKQRQAILEARDARQEQLQRALNAAARAGKPTVLTLAVNIPGADKDQRGATAVVEQGSALLREASSEADGLELGALSVDALGPGLVGFCAAPPEQVKRLSIAIETRAPWARLLDIDVYDSRDGRALGRSELSLPPRRCLLCADAAHTCGRSGRHDALASRRRVEALLAEARGELSRGQALASALARGAVAELELTPKPGLVDLEGSGSHDDLDAETMACSAALLPRYYDALLAARREGATLAELAALGRGAEARMWRAIGCNAHAGYIFLSGLVLVALPDPEELAPLDFSAATGARWRESIASLANEHFDALADARGEGDGPTKRNGEAARERYGVGGIAAEAIAGLPLVFEEALPYYQRALDAGEGPRRAALRVMALAMSSLEDTTALHRCGRPGLERLRRDGATLSALLEDDEAWPEAIDAELRRLDEVYRQENLTMGGVADCLALTLALARHEAPHRRPR